MILQSILLGLGFVLAYLVVVQATSRIIKAAPVTVYFLTALGVHMLSVIVAHFYWPGTSYWHAAAVYWFGFMGYLFVFGAFYKSISLLMLRSIYSRPGHIMNVDDVASDIARPCFTDRFQVMIDMGLARKTAEGRYEITAKGAATADKIKKAQKNFGIDHCGLYKN